MCVGFTTTASAEDEPTPTAIEYTKDKEIVLTENVDGTTQGTVAKYFHYSYTAIEDYDILTITYSDESEKDYFYNSELGAFVYEDEDDENAESEEIPASYVTASDSQSYINQWGTDKDNLITYTYNDGTVKLTTTVSVTIISTNAKSIAFTPAEEIELTENVDGEKTTGVASYFKYQYDVLQDGAVLTVTYNDGDVVNYTYSSDDDEFVSDNDDYDSIPSSYITVSDNQSIVNKWSVGGTNTITITYSGLSATINATLVACPHDNIVTVPAKSATCTDDGNTEGSYCEDCGEEIVKSETISATGHDYKVYKEFDASTTSGHIITTYICDTCKDVKTEVTHCKTEDGDTDYVWIGSYYTYSTTATCTVPGIATYTCTFPDCEQTERKYMSALGHDYINEVVETEPTCTEAGLATYGCSRCGKTDLQKALPATGHDYVVENVDDKTDVDGHIYTTSKCSKCGDEKVEIEHTKWVDGNYTYINTATCTEAGEESYICNVENCTKTEVNQVSAFGHTVKTYTTTVAPTCTVAGTAQGTCEVCGEKVEKAISATGHNYSDKEKYCQNGCGTKNPNYVEIIDASGYKITLSATSYTYNGKAKKPAVTVKSTAGAIISTKYYTVKYSNNKKVGTAKVTVTFDGSKYTGKITKTYKILPSATTVSKLTAKSKGFTVKIKKQATQTTGYQVMYATNSKFTKNKKTVTIKGAKNVTKTIKGLKAKKKYYVKVRTYKVVNGKKYYSSWSKAKTVTTKK
jgi:hypothetical protein